MATAQAELNFGQNYRHTDPESSKAAGRKVTRSGKRLHNALLVLELVKENPGLTSKQLGEVSEELDRSEIARRLPELSSAGKVTRGKCPTTGELTWWAK